MRVIFAKHIVDNLLYIVPSTHCYEFQIYSYMAGQFTIITDRHVKLPSFR